MFGYTKNLMCFSTIFDLAKLQTRTDIVFTASGFFHAEKPNIGFQPAVSDKIQ
jgi:hypothetical protein